MLELIMVRHGATDRNNSGIYYGWTDTPLNKTGKEQALKLHHKLIKEPINRIYTSTLSRAQMTAQIIKGNRDLCIVERENLREINFGEWEGLSHTQIEQKEPVLYKMWCDDWTGYCIPGGESAKMVHLRAVMEINRIIKENKTGRIVVVSHHGCIRSIISYLLGSDLEGCWHYKVEAGGLCRIQILDDGYCVLASLNE